MFLGGLDTASKRGSECYLYLKGFSIDDRPVYFATSTACGGIISIAAISLLVGMIIPVWIGWYKWKNQVIPAKVVFYYACIASALAFTLLVVASVFSAGINATCYEFNRAGKPDCGFVYETYLGVNFTTLKAAAGGKFIRLKN